MSENFVGEIKMVGFNFAQVNWAFCNGAILPISQNEALFSLIGTVYGGDGLTTFGLPDLRGRMPIHQGQGPGQPNYTIGDKSGTETVTLTSATIPAHSHAVRASTSSSGAVPSPAGNVWSANANSASPQFGAPPATDSMNAATVQLAGGNAPHENMAPFLTLNFVIAIFGIYPTQN